MQAANLLEATVSVASGSAQIANLMPCMTTDCCHTVVVTPTLQTMVTSHNATKGTHGVHLLLTGVEVSLWLAEQFASDLSLTFPKLRVQAISANKICQMLGSSCCLLGSTLDVLTPHTVCLAVSQSGQTSPTIHAARALEQLLPGQVFVMTGEWVGWWLWGE